MTRRGSDLYFPPKMRAEIANQQRGRAKTRPWEAKPNGDMQVMRRNVRMGEDSRRADYAGGRGSDDGRSMVRPKWSGHVRIEGSASDMVGPAVHTASRDVSIRGPVQTAEVKWTTMTLEELKTLVASVDLRHSAIKIELKAHEDTAFYSAYPGAAQEPWRAIWVHAKWLVPDRTDGKEIAVNNTTKLNTRMSRAEATATLSKLIHEVYEHEFKECFVIEGRRIHDPHPPQWPFDAGVFRLQLTDGGKNAAP